MVITFHVSKFHLPNFTVSLVTEILLNTKEEFCTVASLLFGNGKQTLMNVHALYRPVDILHFSTCPLLSLSTDNFTFSLLFILKVWILNIQRQQAVQRQNSLPKCREYWSTQQRHSCDQTCFFSRRKNKEYSSFLNGVPELHTKRSPTQSDIYQMLYWYNWFSWWWERSCSKHRGNGNKYIEKNCASNWSFTMASLSHWLTFK
jgi:hypothetical protein